MSKELMELHSKVDFLGNDIEEKDIELRDILRQIINLLEIALPIDRSDDV